MKKVVYKYKLEPVTRLELPIGAEVLSVGAQGEDAVIWILMDSNPRAKTEVRDFVGIPTGQSFETDFVQLKKFIGTIQFENGLVFHIWEEEKDNAAHKET